MMLSSMRMYAIAGAITIMAGAIGYHVIMTARLELSLSQCKADSAALRADSTIARLEVEGLKSVIAAQNRAVDELKVESLARKEAATEAQKEAAENKAASMQAISELTAEIGESCAEGIALIDRELGL